MQNKDGVERGLRMSEGREAHHRAFFLQLHLFIAERDRDRDREKKK